MAALFPPTSYSTEDRRLMNTSITIDKHEAVGLDGIEKLKKLSVFKYIYIYIYIYIGSQHPTINKALGWFIVSSHVVSYRQEADVKPNGILMAEALGMD